MSTLKRVIPTSQMAVMRRELEQAGATDIQFVSAGDGQVEVTATMPRESLAAKMSWWFMEGLH